MLRVLKMLNSSILNFVKILTLRNSTYVYILVEKKYNGHLNKRQRNARVVRLATSVLRETIRDRRAPTVKGSK